MMVVSSSTSDKCYEKVETKDTTCTHDGISQEGKQRVAVPTAAGLRLISEGRCFQCDMIDHCKHDCKAIESLKKEHVMLHLKVFKLLKLIPLLLLITKHGYWIPHVVFT